MPRPRFLRLPDERRQALLDTAARCFAAEGYQGAAMNDVLAAMALSKGAAYYLWDDKADLYITTLGHAADTLAGTRGLDLARLDAAHFWPALREMYRRQLAVLQERPYLMAVLRSARQVVADPVLGPQIQERLGTILDLQTSVIRVGRAMGAIRDDLPEDLQAALLGGLDEAIDGWLLAHPDRLGGKDGAALTDAAFDVLRRALGT